MEDSEGFVPQEVGVEIEHGPMEILSVRITDRGREGSMMRWALFPYWKARPSFIH